MTGNRQGKECNLLMLVKNNGKSLISCRHMDISVCRIVIVFTGKEERKRVISWLSFFFQGSKIKR